MIDCKKIAAEIKEGLKPLVSPDKGLAIIQVGNNPASNIYVRNKIKDCEELNIPVKLYKIEENKTTEDVLSLIDYLNHNPTTKGVICQLPLPSHMDTEKITNAIADSKDADGFKVTSKYTPATPKGVMTILDSLGIDLAGKKVCLVGKGKTTNAPLIPLLLDRGATLTVCHSRTKKEDLDDAVLFADVIISAVGRPNTINKQMFRIGNKYPSEEPVYDVKDKVIIDVGISRDGNGKQIGDVERDLHDMVELCTGYTQSVGLLTRASLLQNLLEE